MNWKNFRVKSTRRSDNKKKHSPWTKNRSFSKLNWLSILQQLTCAVGKTDTLLRWMVATKILLKEQLMKPSLLSPLMFSPNSKPNAVRQDLKVTKKILSIPTDAAVTDDEVETIDVSSELTEEDVSNALAYWYKKGSQEVKSFNKPELIARIAIERDGILYSRSRIMDGHRFIMAAGFNKTSLGKEVQLNLLTPVLDRHSPISYSVALFIHSELANHAGFETCFRFSLSYCHIIQAASLFREIGEECSKCKIIRKKYLDVVMGPVSDHQLTVCPPF